MAAQGHMPCSDTMHAASTLCKQALESSQGALEDQHFGEACVKHEHRALLRCTTPSCLHHHETHTQASTDDTTGARVKGQHLSYQTSSVHWPEDATVGGPG